MAIQEVLFFSERLLEQGMPRDAYVVNRVHRAGRSGATVDEVRGSIARHAVPLGANGAERLVMAATDESRQARLDAAHLERLDRALAGAKPAPLRVDVPALPFDVHDVGSLAEVARVIVGDERRRAS